MKRYVQKPTCESFSLFRLCRKQDKKMHSFVCMHSIVDNRSCNLCNTIHVSNRIRACQMEYCLRIIGTVNNFRYITFLDYNSVTLYNIMFKIFYVIIIAEYCLKFVQISRCLKNFLERGEVATKERKKEVACIVSTPLVSCLWGCGESVNPPELNIQEVQGGVVL